MMSERVTIDVEQLQAELQSARDAFDKWALDTVSTADQLRESHIRNIADLRGTAYGNCAVIVFRGCIDMSSWV